VFALRGLRLTIPDEAVARPKFKKLDITRYLVAELVHTTNFFLSFEYISDKTT